MKKLTKAILSAATLCAFAATVASPVTSRADTANTPFTAPSAFATENSTGAREFTSGSINENFGGYSMPAANTNPNTAIGSIPTGFFITGTIAPSPAPVPTHTGPVDSSFQNAAAWNSDNTTAYGFWDFAASGSGHHALSILEQGSDAFQDGRIFLKFTNTDTVLTATAIQGVNLQYDVQQWVEGKRLNQLKLRFGHRMSDLSGAPDLVTTDAPLDSGNNAGAINGDTNSVTQTETVIFPAQLAATDYGYFRWAFATAGSGNTSGHRDALGITNVIITPIPAGIPLTWNGSQVWENGQPFGAGIWDNGTPIIGNTGGSLDGATFASGSVVNIAGADGIHATDVIVTTGAAFEINAAGFPLVVDGPITVSGNVTSIVDADQLDGQFGLLKSGSGGLTVSSSHLNYSTGITVNSGILTLDGSNAIDSANLGTLAVNTDSSGLGATAQLLGTVAYPVAGLSGSVESTLDFGSATNTVTIDVPANITQSERGAITGTGLIHVVKQGPGTERFRTAVKLFNNDLTVTDGVFELTESTVNGSNITLANNTAVSVTGDLTHQGVLLLSNGKGGTQQFRIGQASPSPVTISINDGTIEASNSTGSAETLLNAIHFSDANSDVNNTINSNGGDDVFTISGSLSGDTAAGFIKKGAGQLILTSTSNSIDPSAIFDINNGTLTINSGFQWNGQALTVTHDENAARVADINQNITVSLLNGNTADGLLVPPATLPTAIAGNGELRLHATSFVVDQDVIFDDMGAEDNTSFQGDITGTGSFTKEGDGWLRLTRYDKSFTGSVTVASGVLEVSNQVPLAHISAFNITSNAMTGESGQLRLTSKPAVVGGTQNFAVGGAHGINLASTQRTVDATVVTGSQFGVDGGLRYDQGQGQATGNFNSPIHVTGASDIHVNGVDKVLVLTSTLDGSSALNRTGGGKVTLTGSGSSYSGVLTLTNGATTVGSATTLGNGTQTYSVGSADLAELGAESTGGTVHANVHVVSGGYLSAGEQFSYPGGDNTQQATVTGVFNAVGPLAITGTLTTDIGSKLIPFDATGTLNGVSVSGAVTFNGAVDVQGVTLLPSHTYTLITAGSTVNGTPTVVGAPAGTTVTAFNSVIPTVVHQLRLTTP